MNGRPVMPPVDPAIPHETTATPAAVSPRGRADLHVHTTHSDGVCSPCEVVIAAARVGLAALAITDHDTVSALPAARDEAARLGLELINGVELTCELDGRELHLLGYFFDGEDPALLAAASRLRDGRLVRLHATVEKLEALGLSVDLDALGRAFPRATLGRRHLAEYLSRTGQVTSAREAFARYLGDSRPACLPKPRLEAAAAIALVRNAGGATALAHPPFYLRRDRLRALAGAGLRALEVAGPGISNRLGRRFRAWADELGLVPIAGSDFHAPDRPGRWVGAVTTPPSDLQRLREARPRYNMIGRESGSGRDEPQMNTDERRSIQIGRE
ncbi:MAG: PHP domain-containing protein [Isosphaeraceae bacterium]